jgi:hypothetical protein
MPGSKPGERRGGRQKGTPNRVNALKRAEIAASGETPLDYMLRIMRDETVDPERRDQMARSAAPYLHAKLQAIGEANVGQEPQIIKVVRLSDLPSEGTAPDALPFPSGRSRATR